MLIINFFLLFFTKNEFKKKNFPDFGFSLDIRSHEINSFFIDE